ncbi:Gcd10p family-domain-containing protein [Spinellus fusiger]|nr:Gcd10p family-domain-containing protein [Spinellus fusiger]
MEATVPSEDLEDELPHIQPMQFVLIHMPSGNVKIVAMKPDSTVALGKFGSFQCNNLIGQPFGLSYEIYDREGNIRPVPNMALTETEANNQTIIDDKSVQLLSQAQVEKLKQEGLDGNIATEEIIRKMIESHTEFNKKTEFSKAKYIQRKMMKFLKVFTPVRPTLFSITQYFLNKNPEKIRHLRIDTLSQILSFANVRAYSKLLVVDDTQGLIISAVAERMGGYGALVGLHDGKDSNYDVVRYMNFSKAILDTIHTVPFSMINSEKGYGKKMPCERVRRSYETRTRARDLLLEGEFDGLIISSQYNPEMVLRELSKYLLGSRPVVVYSFYKEMLVDAAYMMRKSGDYLHSDITESSLREYQVLPGRTHPHMTTNGGGGFILSGLRVINCTFDPSLVVRGEGSSKRGKARKTAA